jgi:hypothetical protein
MCEEKACIVIALLKAGLPAQSRLPACLVDFRLLLIMIHLDKCGGMSDGRSRGDREKLEISGSPPWPAGVIAEVSLAGT